MIWTLDLNFQGTEKTIASFLIEGDDGLILVESGPYSCYDQLKREVENLGFSITAIKYVLLTHIHFDHAGAAWKLAEQGASIFVHPFGAKHLINPEKLISSASLIYGERMDVLWGDIKPIAEEMIVAVEDRKAYLLGGKIFTPYFTPGHARHHVCWFSAGLLFSGDVAGVSIDEGPVMPPCPPPDIDVEAWMDSIDLMENLPIASLYLTHYGKVTTDIKQHFTVLKGELRVWVEWIETFRNNGGTQTEALPAFSAFIRDRLSNFGLNDDELMAYELANPSFMSVAGLYRYLGKKET